MSAPSIKTFDTSNLTAETLVAFTSFINQRRAEKLPDDPPRTSEHWRKHFAGLKGLESWKEYHWLAWAENKIVGLAWAGLPCAEDNRHLMRADLYVLPVYRRRGLGTDLLPKLTALAQQEGRSLFIADISSKVPAGTAFAEAIGARVGIEDHTNQLELKDLDRELIARWQKEGRQRAHDFEIGCWIGNFPEEELEAVCRLIELMNNEPRGELEVEDFKVTPKQLKEDEVYLARTGIERWTFFARHMPTGNFAGYTQTGWEPDTPETVWQWGTAVDPKYRGKGLGKWLKAAMLDKILAERPQVTRIRTGNADVNAPMLAINRQLGFKPYIANTAWQIDLETLKAYLAVKEAALSS